MQKKRTETLLENRSKTWLRLYAQNQLPRCLMATKAFDGRLRRVCGRTAIEKAASKWRRRVAEDRIVTIIRKYPSIS